MKLLISILLVALTGCATSQSTPSNLKLVEDQNFSHTEGYSVMTIRWVRVSHERLQTICELSTSVKNARGRFLGCAGRTLGGGCIIHTSTALTHQILGHELRHCFQGNFHE